MINKSFFCKYKHIHFVGIGGISMSALAKLCVTAHIEVSGSDKTQSHITDELFDYGINVKIGHSANNACGADLLVYTCAVSEDNVEIEFAKKHEITIMERADFLGFLSHEYNNVIAISGTHGKTTTSAMIGSIFEHALLKPTIIVGGEETSIGGNLKVGDKNFLILEACEYQRHFLKFKHEVGVVLNIEYDHPDTYANLNDLELTYAKFAANSSKINIISEKYKMFIDDKKIKCITFGENGNFFAKKIKFTQNKMCFKVYKDQKFFVSIKLNCLGLYNVENALCAIAVADFFSINKQNIKKGLCCFKNVKRRYEYMGEIDSNTIIQDYAHHPAQIKNCILTTKKIYNKKITIVFEPHTFSRTKCLFNDFINVLMQADNIILLPTYSAREKPIRGGSSKSLYNALKTKQKNVHYYTTYQSCLKQLLKLKNNVILIVGAGSIENLANEIMQLFPK